jgi:hypothetical protein
MGQIRDFIITLQNTDPEAARKFINDLEKIGFILHGL